jgi:hypothetical protein
VTLGLLDYLSTRAFLPGRDRDIDFLPPIFVLRARHRIALTCPLDAMATGGHTSGDAVTGVTVSFTIIAVICTVLRLYTRFALNKMGGVDDVFIAIATVCSPRQIPRPALTRRLDSISGTHDHNVRSRYVSPKLNDSQRSRKLIHGSQIWHGTTLIVTHCTRPLVDQQMVLVEPVDLLPCPLLR